MFITPAYAQVAGGQDAFATLFPFVLIFVVFYFLLIRPQMRQRKQHQTMLTQLRRGDKVVTGGGIIGTVTKVNSDVELTVQIAEGVKVVVARSTISNVLSKPEPTGGAGTASNNNTAEKPKGLLDGLFGGRK